MKTKYTENIENVVDTVDTKNAAEAEYCVPPHQKAHNIYAIYATIAAKVPQAAR
ncbi:MAG: hypothetical protein Q4A71_06635 [Actinomycetaceae bacterium]|nr:hypothetical protein [Actinomycetaceae bacterium]